MQGITITFTKATIKTTVESLLWKYGGAIDNGDNFRQVYNTKSESGADNVDERVLNDSFSKRTAEAFEMLEDYMEAQSPTYTSTIASAQLEMPTRWAGKSSVLQRHLDKYVVDGMMADWLNVAAPNAAAVYANMLGKDELDIKNELYRKGAPA